MALFKKKPDNGLSSPPSLLDDVEKLWRRAKTLPLAAPLLLLVGFGLGEATTTKLELPEDTPVHRPRAAVQRVQLEALSTRMSEIRSAGEVTEDYVTIYRDHVEPVEKVLRRRGVPETRARKIAWPLVEHASRRGLPIETVISIMLMESDAIPNATSSVGARGLMQVMPFWSGKWRNCGRDLYDIDANLCNGTSILAWYYDRFDGDERRALLGYNGCVRGTNTPNCFIYPDKLNRLRGQIERELIRARARPGRAAAP